MASLGQWTVIFEDRAIIKQGVASYGIEDDAFWSQQKYSNIWAIHFGNAVSSDEVEYRDETPNSSYVDANLGNFQVFIDKWDSQHLVTLQQNWDDNNVEGETSEQKITRLGARPTTYSS